MKYLKSILVSLGITATVGAIAVTATSHPPPSLKEIQYRGGLIRFDVPHDWMEEKEPDGGTMFYSPGPDTGTLRLNVITASSPKDLDTSEQKAILEGIRGVDPESVRMLSNGSFMAYHIDRTAEEGTPITLYWWHKTHLVDARHIRLASFSYTVRTTQEGDETTLADVAILSRSIEAAEFHPELGQFEEQ
ncbi:MAG: hypothetical protein Q7T68_03515 [Sphingopyxis sp.]|nr:hypothetical protein [Sphingopyxis sp.]